MPIPTPGRGEARIRVEYAGICASDLHILNDDIAITLKPPVVMGHEFSGTIDRLGEDVEGWKPGDRVVAEASYTVCGTCRYCRDGFYNLCPGREVLGYWHDGVFARYTVVPGRRLHALPPEVSFEQGALVEPTACVAHGLCELIRIERGDTVLITGPGAIGLTALQIAKAAGATVLVSGRAEDRERLRIAQRLGADGVLDAEGELAAGKDVDLAIECSGNDRAVRSAIAALRKGGQFLQLGLLCRDLELNFDTVAFKELRITGAISSRDVSWRTAIDLIRRRLVRPEALISHILPLEEWESAFRLHAQRKGLKILFKTE